MTGPFWLVAVVARIRPEVDAQSQGATHKRAPSPRFFCSDVDVSRLVASDLAFTERVPFDQAPGKSSQGFAYPPHCAGLEPYLP